MDLPSVLHFLFTSSPFSSHLSHQHLSSSCSQGLLDFLLEMIFNLVLIATQSHVYYFFCIFALAVIYLCLAPSIKQSNMYFLCNVLLMDGSDAWSTGFCKCQSSYIVYYHNLAIHGCTIISSEENHWVHSLTVYIASKYVTQQKDDKPTTMPPLSLSRYKGLH